MVKLEHPTTKHQVTISYANWKGFCLGIFWLMWHRDWGDTVLFFFAALFTLGFAWFIWPFLAENRLTEHYQRQGYRIIDSKPREGWESPWAPIAVFFGLPIILVIFLFSLGIISGILEGY